MAFDPLPWNFLMRYTFAFLCCWVSPLFGQSDAPVSPVAEGAKVVQLAEGFKFTEGPTSDAEGNVYFTDQPNNRIHRWSIDGKLSTFLEPAGRSNGLFIDSQGTLWACADENNELWKIDVKTKAITKLENKYQNKLLNGPNDVWVHPNGNAYFTDPFYKRPYWNRGAEEQDKRGLYYLNTKGKLQRVDDDYGQPNGIVGTADGKTLFVADIGKKKTYRYTIGKDGVPQDRKLFCEMGSDGMTLDKNGNLYLTGRGVTVFSPEGKPITTIAIPENWTANVCFGGKDHKTLFITASKGLYALQMTVAGH